VASNQARVGALNLSEAGMPSAYREGPTRRTAFTHLGHYRFSRCVIQGNLIGL